MSNNYYGRGRLYNHPIPDLSFPPQPTFPMHNPTNTGPAFPPRNGAPQPQPPPPGIPLHPEAIYAPNAAMLYNHATAIASAAAAGAPPDSPGFVDGHYAPSNAIPRLPPILQVEKQQVTTSATQAASASRRRNEAHFLCPVPGCGSTFTRRFNLRGHLRSHTEERPYVCEWPGCNKGFARQHDCKRHQALHSSKTHANVCPGCGKTFSRLDALNRHLRSEGGAECRQSQANAQAAQAAQAQQTAGSGSDKIDIVFGDNHEDWERRSNSAGGQSVDDASKLIKT